MVLLIFPPARQILCIRRESMSPREDDISPTSTSVETRTEGARECKKEYGKESKAGRNEKEKGKSPCVLEEHRCKCDERNVYRERISCLFKCHFKMDETYVSFK